MVFLNRLEPKNQLYLFSVFYLFRRKSIFGYQGFKMNDNDHCKKITDRVILLGSFILIIISPNLYAAGEGTRINVSPTPITSREDSVVAETIKQKLSEDQRISTPNIDVKVNGGVVSLSGFFNDPDEASAAIEDIASMAGVSDIDVTQVVLATGNDNKFNDLVITSRIQGLFIREEVFGKKPINEVTVETNDGVVFLTGAVDDSAQRQKAIDLAEMVPNVKKVIPKIAIKWPVGREVKAP